jgi:hypothetical protein
LLVQKKETKEKDPPTTKLWGALSFAFFSLGTQRKEGLVR